jgi:hypothetical protein
VAPGGVLMVRPRLGFRWNFWKLAVCLHTVPTTLQIAQLWLQSSNEHLSQVSDHFAHLGLAPESLTSGSPTTEPIEHRTPYPRGPSIQARRPSSSCSKQELPRPEFSEVSSTFLLLKPGRATSTVLPYTKARHEEAEELSKSLTNRLLPSLN